MIAAATERSSSNIDEAILPGADPENIEPGGATVYIIRLNRGGGGGAQIYIFVLHIRANRGRAPDAPPLNPRLITEPKT